MDGWTNISNTDDQSKKVSPLPWTIHTDRSGFAIEDEEAFVRAHDEEDGILGEIIAHFTKEDDAWWITELSKGKINILKIPNSIKQSMRLAYSALIDCYNEHNIDDDIDLAMVKLKNAGEKYGFDIEKE